jgi:hypothetical protein
MPEFKGFLPACGKGEKQKTKGSQGVFRGSAALLSTSLSTDVENATRKGFDCIRKAEKQLSSEKNRDHAGRGGLLCPLRIPRGMIAPFHARVQALPERALSHASELFQKNKGKRGQNRSLFP